MAEPKSLCVEMYFEVQHSDRRQGRRLCPRNETQWSAPVSISRNRLVKTDIGWRQSIGAENRRYHTIFTLVFAGLKKKGERHGEI